MDLFSEVRDTQYDLKSGPLWTVKMVCLPKEEASPRGIKAKIHYMVVFGIHHCITDAASNMFICKEFFNILNDILQGRNIIDKSYTLSLPHADKQVESSIAYLTKYFLGRFFNVLVFDFNKNTTFNGIMPLPKDYVAKTKMITHVFDEETSTNIFKVCRFNKTSVHSCILAAINSAYYDVVNRNTSKKVPSIHVYFTDCIDMRRYYPEESKSYLGCNMTFHEQDVEVPSNHRELFWNRARTLKKSLHEDIEGKRCIHVLPLIKLSSIVFLVNYWKNKKGFCNTTGTHYITTNMGNVTNSMKDLNPEDPIQVTDLLRSVNAVDGAQLFTLTFETFRGRLHLSIDYYTNKMLDEQANNIFDDMKNNLYAISTTGNI